eukprot:7971-Heterococcus_DN1.PRE.1
MTPSASRLILAHQVLEAAILGAIHEIHNSDKSSALQALTLSITALCMSWRTSFEGSFQCAVSKQAVQVHFVSAREVSLEVAVCNSAVANDRALRAVTTRHCAIDRRVTTVHKAFSERSLIESCSTDLFSSRPSTSSSATSTSATIASATSRLLGLCKCLQLATLSTSTLSGGVQVLKRARAAETTRPPGALGALALRLPLPPPRFGPILSRRGGAHAEGTGTGTGHTQGTGSQL